MIGEEEMLFRERDRIILKISRGEKLCKKEINTAIWLGLLKVAG